jgi:D-aspartate ligase
LPGSFGRKAFLEHDLREAEEHLEACLGVGLPMVLQEFVPGPATGHVFVDGFVDRSGIVRARLARRRLRPYPHELGNSSSGISIAPAEVAESVAALEKLLVSLPYRGIFSAEFKQDEESGVYKLLEINCRPFWYVDFARRCGVNLCLMAYRDALGAPVRTVDEYRVGLPFGFAMVEVRALLDQSRRGTVTRGALASGLLRMTKLPFRFDDPGPALVRLTQVTRGRVLRV